MYHNNDRNLEAREMSLSPGMRDNAQDYNNLIGSMNNPLSTYGDGNKREGFGRGAFPLNNDGWNTVTIAADGTFSVIFDATFVEELFLSPLVFGGGMDQGFIGLQSIDINITWDCNSYIISKE